MKNLLMIITLCFGLGIYSVQGQVNQGMQMNQGMMNQGIQLQGTVTNDQAFVNRTPYDASYNNPRIDPSNMTNAQYDAIYNNPNAPGKKDDDDCPDISPAVKEDTRIEHRRSSHSIPS